MASKEFYRYKISRYLRLGEKIYQRKNLPKLSKMILRVSLIYSVSPVDLIPDFIPLLGFVDDLLIIPGLVTLAIKTIPKEKYPAYYRMLKEEQQHIEKAKARFEKYPEEAGAMLAKQALFIEEIG